MQRCRCSPVFVHVLSCVASRTSPYAVRVSAIRACNLREAPEHRSVSTRWITIAIKSAKPLQKRDHGSRYNVCTKGPSQVEIGVRRLQAQTNQGTYTVGLPHGTSTTTSRSQQDPRTQTYLHSDTFTLLIILDSATRAGHNAKIARNVA